MNDFMKDRYGVDELTTIMGIAGMVLVLIGTIAQWQWLTYVGLILVVLALVRALSKNLDARKRENERWLELAASIPGAGSLLSGKGAGSAGAADSRPTADDLKRQVRTTKKMWKDRKTKSFLKCPTCGAMLAVPKGKGKLIVTCPKCRTRMETRS